MKSKARLSSANADARTLWGCLAASPMSFECPRDRHAHETPHVEAAQRHPAYLATAEELRVRWEKEKAGAGNTQPALYHRAPDPTPARGPAAQGNSNSYT